MAVGKLHPPSLPFVLIWHGGCNPPPRLLDQNDFLTCGCNHFEGALLVKAEAFRQAFGDLGEAAGVELENKIRIFRGAGDSIEIRGIGTDQHVRRADLVEDSNQRHLSIVSRHDTSSRIPRRLRSSARHCDSDQCGCWWAIPDSVMAQA